MGRLVRRVGSREGKERGCEIDVADICDDPVSGVTVAGGHHLAAIISVMLSHGCRFLT